MKKRKLWLLYPLLCLLLVFGLSSPALAAVEPVQAFYGDLTIGSVGAPPGTVVIAKVAEMEFDITTETEGEYGGSGGLDPKLVVEGPIEDGTIVDFYVTSVELGLVEVKTNEIALFDDGEFTERHLTVDDTTDPTVTMGDIADDVNVLAQISGTASDDIALEKVRVSIENTTDSVFWNGTDWLSETEVWLDATGTETWTYTMPALTSDTSYQVRAKAIDTSANESTVVSDSFTFDNEAPTAIVSPVADAPDVAVDALVTATFDEDVTLVGDLSGITIAGANGVSATLDEGIDTITIDHDNFTSQTLYTVTIPAGVVQDLAGNPNDEISWSFTSVTITYALTVDSTEGGTATDVTNASPYEAGASVSIKAVVADGYQFVNWTATAGGFVAASEAETTFTMPAEAATVTANFELIAPTYALTVDSTEGGTATDVTNASPYEAGAVVSIKAVVAEGYQFVNWTATAGGFVAASEAETTFTMPAEAATVTANFAIVGPVSFTTTLVEDWNLLSTPILLDADSDSMGQIFDAQSLASIEIYYSWNAVSEDWDQVLTDYELLPLYAIYIRVSSGASATAQFIPSGVLSWPPTRELQRGLNLIGPAPEAPLLANMPLNLALISIEEAESGFRGYTMVISPPHNQTPWSYALGGEIKDLLPYEGYWVVMENGPDTLFGFSTTGTP